MSLISNIVLAALFVGVIACGDSSSNRQNKSDDEGPKAAPDKENILGGMTGGGGGVILAEPVGQEEAAKTIALVQSHLKLFFNRLSYPDHENLYLDSLSKKATFLLIGLSSLEVESLKKEALPGREIYSRVLGTDIARLHATLKAMTIRDAKTEPCFFDGQATDGSYLPQEGMCLSSKRLGQQLTRAGIYSQTMALSLHEFAHALGANEEDAIAVQKAALEYFSLVSPKAGSDMLSQARPKIDLLKDRFSDNNMRPDLFFRNAVDDAVGIAGTMTTQVEGLALYTRDQMKTYFGMRSQLFVYKTAAFEVDFENKLGRETADTYNTVFKDRSEILCDLFMVSFDYKAAVTENTISDQDCRHIRVIDKNRKFAGSFSDSKKNIINSLSKLQQYLD